MEINDTLNILNLTQAEITALGTVDAGTIVYNSTTNALETYNGTAWIPSGGGGGHNPYITEQTIYPHQILGGIISAAANLGIPNYSINATPFSFAQDVQLKKVGVAGVTTPLISNNGYTGLYKLISKSIQSGIEYYRFDLEHSITPLFNFSVAGDQEITLSTPYTMTAGEVYVIVVFTDQAAANQNTVVSTRYNFQGGVFLGKQNRSLRASTTQAYNPYTINLPINLPPSLYMYPETTGYNSRDPLMINIQNA